MEKERNIFDTAAKKLGKAKASKGKEKKQQRKKKDKGKRWEFGPTKDPELTKMMNQLNTMKDDLKEKFEKITQRTGWTVEQIHQFIQNPKNLSKEEYEKLKQDQQDLANEVWKTVGPELKPRTSPKREKPQNERKGKTLGSRKGWLPVH